MNLTQTVTQIRQQFQTLGDTINTLGGIVLGGAPTRGITRMTGRYARETPITHMGRNRRTPTPTGQNTGTPPTHKRTLSPAGRKAIAAAQKRRWALLKGGAGTKKAA